ncbi:MAG TPA: Na+/H+ antiporter [Anaerolineae bacterium]|nr:Na+/H+ antiporter [Anaerolineae bacterium]
MEGLSSETVFVALLFIASLVAIIAKRLRLPYTIALVITGLLAGLFVSPLVPAFELTPHLILQIFLPALLFEAAFHLDFGHLWDNIRIITLLAIPGVLLSTFVVGLILHLGVGLAWPVALLFGSLISATDPISVLAIFKELGVARRLSIIVEGESLFNDGTSIVLFRILMAIVLTGQFSLVGSIQQFVQVTFGGALLGLLVGYFFSHLIRPIDDYLVEVALTTVLAYGIFFLAEALHISGVIAVVITGLVVGNYGTRIGMSPTTKLNLVSFWGFIAFVVNSWIFLLLGLQIDLPVLIAEAYPILWAIGAVLAARAIVAYPMTHLIYRFVRPMPSSWHHVLFWGGLRGSITLALALGLEAAIPHREVLRVMAFGYVLFSLLVQGLTMRPLLGRLNLVCRAEERLEYERTRGQLLALRAAWQMLREMQEDGILSPLVWQTLNSEYRLEGERLAAELEALYQNHAHLQQDELMATRRECLRAQKSALLSLLQQGVISEEVYRDLVTGLDRQLETLDKWVSSQLDITYTAGATGESLPSPAGEQTIGAKRTDSAQVNAKQGD